MISGTDLLSEFIQVKLCISKVKLCVYDYFFFSVNWYFPTMKQLAEITVSPKLNKIIGI